MSERKVLDIRVAILVGIICILAIGLVGDTLVIEQMKGQISWANEVFDILNFACTRDWITTQTVSQPANSYSSWTNLTIYAGILYVNVLNSTTYKTYVEVIYETQGINYDERIEVRSGGSASFPLMPAWIEVRVGNSDPVSGATETVSMGFVY
jgi:hypothetical protein